MEQEILQACKSEMRKRFDKARTVIGKPSSTSQYDKPYTNYRHV